VQLHDGATAGFLVQVINVLRDELMHAALQLELRERAMCGIRARDRNAAIRDTNAPNRSAALPRCARMR
jgi:hypothetical protein